MTFYGELIERPEAFYRRNIPESFELANIGLFLIRSGSEKGSFLSIFLNSLGLSPCSKIIPPDWDEDSVCNYIPPQIKAIMKTIDSILDMRERTNFINGHILSVASDVELKVGDQVLTKPSGANSKSEIADQMKKILVDNEEITFTLESSTAVFGKDFRNVSDQGRGLSSTEVFTVVVRPFTEEEINQYVQEVELFNLRKSNLGIRWPHPIFENHIISINGVTPDNSEFYKTQIQFYFAVLGTPYTLIDLIRFYDHNWQSMSEGSSLYPKFPGQWWELIRIKNEEIITLQSPTNQDFPLISRMVQSNFQEAPNYAQLEYEERNKFLLANSPEGIAQVCQHPNNLATVVAKDSQQNIIGFMIVRKNSNHHGAVANIRRLHVELNTQGKGLGKILMSLAERITKEHGINLIEIQASGTSSDFFTRLGYNRMSGYLALSGVFNGEPSSSVLVVKQL